MMRSTNEPTAVVLDLDQAELCLNPTRTRVWAPVGVPYELETPGNNRKQVVFGAVNSRTGQTYTAFTPHKRSEDFQRFVDAQLIPAHQGVDYMFLLVDGGSIYSSHSTREWLKQRPQVVLVPLPSYAPKLNLQEQIWRWMRREVTHSHYYGSFEAVLKAAERFFAKLAAQPQAVLRYLGRAYDLLEHHLATIL